MDSLGNREQGTGDSRPRQQAIGKRPQQKQQGKRQEATAQSREQGTGNREQQRTQTKSGLPGVNDRYSHGLKVAEVPGYNCHAME